MPGPPKKPHSLKVLIGTSRSDRDAPPAVDLPALEQIPEPPDWLGNVHAVKEWRRLAPLLVGPGLLTEASLSAFGVMCSTFGEIVKMTAAGMPPTAHLVAQYRNLANDFGLSPVALGRVKPTGDKKQANRFDKFREGSK